MSQPAIGAGARHSRRVPGVVLAAWAVAAVLLAALAVAVIAHLRRGGSTHAAGGMGQMTGMGGGLSEALYRAGGADPHGSLLSSRLITVWQLDAVAVAVLLILGTLYLTGTLLLRRAGRPWRWNCTVSFLAGLLVCGLATNSSISVYDMSLFSAHMIGHLMLVMLGPALLMAGRPLTLLLEATHGRRHDRIAATLRGPVVSLLTAPPVALASYTVVIVGTHLTGLMNVIMRNSWAGQLEHLGYLLLGCQFFVVVIGDAPIRWKLSAPARLFMLALSMAVDTFTGVVLLQSTTAIAMSPPPGTSINPITDTQTGGAIMWFGGDGIMAVIMVVVAIGWVHRPESAQIEAGGWLEQARRANFAKHAGIAAGGSAQHPGGDSGNDSNSNSGSNSNSDFDIDSNIDSDFDNDDERLAQYNAWLRRLDSGRQ